MRPLAVSDHKLKLTFATSLHKFCLQHDCCLLAEFGATPDCDANIPGTPTPFYDTDVSTCNALAVDVQVQSTSEPYMGALLQNSSYACYGVVNETFVPSSLKIDANTIMAPMQPPFYVQAVLEAGVKAKLAQ
eukprot:10597-Heterococcus_DN1.PRE.1